MEPEQFNIQDTVEVLKSEHLYRQIFTLISVSLPSLLLKYEHEK